MALRRRQRLAALAGCLFVQAALDVARAAPLRMELDEDWELESSARVQETGSALSQPTFHGAGWAAATLPNTIVGALVDNGRLPDPYPGMALRSLPGMGYAAGELFNGPMPADSPFRLPWWFRRVFELPEVGPERHIWLRFDGVNYRANVWINGRQIASADEMVGAFRRYEYDVTEAVKVGGKNAVAVEVFPPGTDGLAFTWIDWNPKPPDKAYSRNRYRATGVIVWMLNNAWPSMTWHLYDYYLRPGGGFFGAKKACEALHVQFSYDDRSVVVVNDLQQPFDDLVLTAELLDFDLVPLFRKRATLRAEPDSVTRVFTVPRPRPDGRVQFLQLRLGDSAGNPRSRNFYWLSTRDDVLDWKKAHWSQTPTKVDADFSGLAQLGRTTLGIVAKGADSGAGTSVIVENDGPSLAFQVHLRLLDTRSGREILPVYWEDNYFELMPGEARNIDVAASTAPGGITVEAEAWNADRIRAVP